MKIIIIGDNLTAQAIAHALYQASGDITIIGEDQKNLKKITSKVNIQTVYGQYINMQTLHTAECLLAKVVIAATDCTTTNFLLAQMVQKIFQVPKIISLIPNAVHTHINTICPRQETSEITWISPDQTIGNYIANRLHNPQYRQYSPINKTNTIICINIGNITKKSSNSWLKAYLKPSQSFAIIAILRNGKYIAHPEVLRKNDQIIILCNTKQHLKNTKDIAPPKKTRHIMIAGISSITEYLIYKLYPTYKITVIETNLEKATELAQHYPQLTILEGNINDTELLIAEGIDTTDVFLALSTDDENNLVSALQAITHNVNTIYTLITRPEISTIIKRNALFCIEPHSILTNQIFRTIYHPTLKYHSSLHHDQGDVIICQIHAHLNGTPIANLEKNLDAQSKICLLQRNQDTITACSHKILQENDKIIVFCAHAADFHNLMEQLRAPEENFFFNMIS